MYFSIFYKTFKIDWVLIEFTKQESTDVVAKILKKTTNTTVISYGNLLCRSKQDLDIIYKILMSESKKIKKRGAEYKNLPDLFEESAKQLSILIDND